MNLFILVLCPPQLGRADAEVTFPSAENQELLKILSFRHRVGQNIALHAWSAAEKCVFLVVSSDHSPPPENITCTRGLLLGRLPFFHFCLPGSFNFISPDSSPTLHNVKSVIVLHHTLFVTWFTVFCPHLTLADRTLCIRQMTSLLCIQQMTSLLSPSRLIGHETSNTSICTSHCVLRFVWICMFINVLLCHWFFFFVWVLICSMLFFN